METGNVIKFFLIWETLKIVVVFVVMFSQEGVKFFGVESFFCWSIWNCFVVDMRERGKEVVCLIHSITLGLFVIRWISYLIMTRAHVTKQIWLHIETFVALWTDKRLLNCKKNVEIEIPKFHRLNYSKLNYRLIQLDSPLCVRLWISILAHDGNIFLQILQAFSPPEFSLDDLPLLLLKITQLNNSR